jgi:SAM-dependent methyltransferase
MDLPVSWFDCIVMIATLHHLPTEPVLERIREALTPDGVLILHDLLRPNGALGRAADLVRLPLRVAVRWVWTGRLWPRREVRKAWAEHGKDERYLTKREVVGMRDGYLQGGYVKYHLLWRYTVVWCKQSGAHKRTQRAQRAQSSLDESSLKRARPLIVSLCRLKGEPQ